MVLELSPPGGVGRCYKAPRTYPVPPTPIRSAEGVLWDAALVKAGISKSP